MTDINSAYLEFRLSGGAANTDPTASLGGELSSTPIRSASVAGLSSVTGVVALDAPAAEEGGDGELTFTATGQTLSWRAPGDTVGGTAVAVATDGRYTLLSGNGTQLFVEVTAASLPATDATDSAVAVTKNSNQLWDDIAKTEAWQGATEYRCVYVVNTHPDQDFLEVQLYIPQQPTGVDSLSIGLDPAGAGGTATTVADEVTAPGGVTFSAPSSIATGALNMGALAAGEGYPYWERRVVPTNVTTPTPVDESVVTAQMVY